MASRERRGAAKHTNINKQLMEMVMRIPYAQLLISHPIMISV